MRRAARFSRPGDGVVKLRATIARIWGDSTRRGRDEFSAARGGAARVTKSGVAQHRAVKMKASCRYNSWERCGDAVRGSNARGADFLTEDPLCISVDGDTGGCGGRCSRRPCRAREWRAAVESTAFGRFVT